MACITCPYQGSYELLWKDDTEPARICVKLWCCAGPELQIREKGVVVRDEYFTNPSELYERAEVLRTEYLGALPV